MTQINHSLYTHLLDIPHPSESNLAEDCVNSTDFSRVMPCRCRYNKCGVASLLAVAFVLSILSSLDCKFVEVDVGFSPTNTFFDTSSTTFGIGLWTMEDPMNPGLCLMPLSKKQYGSLTKEDDIYDSFFVTSDVFITTARFLAMFGIIFGLIDLVSCCELPPPLRLKQKGSFGPSTHICFIVIVPNDSVYFSFRCMLGHQYSPFLHSKATS